MNIQITYKSAIVCGSSQGIGRAVAEELARLGANVTLMARNEEKLKEVVAGLDTRLGQEHHLLVADFSNPDEVKQKINEHVKVYPAHILVNNTGGPAPGQAIDANPESFIDAFKQHLINNQHLVQATVPFMKKESYGRIVNIISTSVKVPIPNLGVSNTIRGAVANWSKTLSRELASFGITVNNVLPGLTMTHRLESLIKSRAQTAGITEEEQIKLMKSAVPVGRFAEASEVAAAVAFLTGPSAAYINGINLPVDGGNTPSL